MIEHAAVEIPFVTPDLGPVQEVRPDELERALHALSRYRSVLLDGRLECPVGADLLDQDETLVATYGDENVTVHMGSDDVIVAIGHRHGTEHLLIDADLLKALGVLAASPDPRITVLRVVDFARAVFERAGSEGVAPRDVPDGIRFASDLACALGRPAAIAIENAVGGDRNAPILPGSCEGAAGGRGAEDFAHTPFLCVEISGGRFGSEMVIYRSRHAVSPSPMDAVSRMRIVAEARARGMEA